MLKGLTSKLYIPGSLLKTAYLGRDKQYDKLIRFAEYAGLYPSDIDAFKTDKRNATRARIGTYLCDLCVVGAYALMGQPLILIGLGLTTILHGAVATVVSYDLKESEHAKEGILNNFYFYLDSSVPKKKNNEQSPSPTIYSQELGLDSIDKLIKEEYTDKDGNDNKNNPETDPNETEGFN